jgi:hypothetical protein
MSSDDDNGKPSVTKGWQLRKEITLGNLLTATALAVAAFGYIVTNEKEKATIDGRVGSMQQQISTHQAQQLLTDAKQEAQLENLRRETSQSLGKIDDKLTTLLTNSRNK